MNGPRRDDHARDPVQPGEPTLLRWTGHALVDVGIAGLCAFAGRDAPGELTLEDLDRASTFMERHYYEGALNAYLSCVFMNSSFVQPNEGADKKAAFVEHYLRAHRAAPHEDVAGQRCAFSGEPATSPLVRTHLPMFSGEGVLNFRPNAATCVPAAGPYVVALMFLPLASVRSEGKLLAVHADEPRLQLAFARCFLGNNRKLLALPLPTQRAPVFAMYEREIPSWDAAKKRYKFADAKGPRSLVVSDLTAVAREALPSDHRPDPVAVTAYLLSSSGQGPSLEIVQVPSGVVSFVVQAAAAPTRKAWEAVAKRFRAVAQKEEGADDRKRAKRATKKKGAAPPPAGRPGWSRNPAFEELCAIFDAGFTDKMLAAQWLRRHVLGRLERKNEKADYRGAGARSWKLAELFLTEVFGMKKGRVEAIRAFADKLAGWIHAKTDKRLYQALLYDKLSELSHRLRRAQQESAGGELLFGLDEYRDVWLHEDGDRFLVRDLVSIRVVERLHELGWFREHPDAALAKEDDAPSDEEATKEESDE